MKGAQLAEYFRTRLLRFSGQQPAPPFPHEKTEAQRHSVPPRTNGRGGLTPRGWAPDLVFVPPAPLSPVGRPTSMSTDLSSQSRPGVVQTSAAVRAAAGQFTSHHPSSSATADAPCQLGAAPALPPRRGRGTETRDSRPPGKNMSPGITPARPMLLLLPPHDLGKQVCLRKNGDTDAGLTDSLKGQVRSHLRVEANPLLHPAP